MKNISGPASNSFFAIFGKQHASDKNAPTEVQADDLQKELIDFIGDNGSKFTWVRIYKLPIVNVANIKDADINNLHFSP